MKDSYRPGSQIKKETGKALQLAAYLLELKTGQIIDILVEKYLQEYLKDRKDEEKSQKIISEDFLSIK